MLCNPQFDNALYEKTLSLFALQSGCQLISFRAPGLWDRVEEHGSFPPATSCRILQTSQSFLG